MAAARTTTPKTDPLMAEAQNVATPPARLAEIFHAKMNSWMVSYKASDFQYIEAILMNPATPTEILIGQCERRIGIVCKNPIFTLLRVEFTQRIEEYLEKNIRGDFTSMTIHKDSWIKKKPLAFDVNIAFSYFKHFAEKNDLPRHPRLSQWCDEIISTVNAESDRIKANGQSAFDRIDLVHIFRAFRRGVDLADKGGRWGDEVLLEIETAIFPDTRQDTVFANVEVTMRRLGSKSWSKSPGAESLGDYFDKTRVVQKVLGASDQKMIDLGFWWLLPGLF